MFFEVEQRVTHHSSLLIVSGTCQDDVVHFRVGNELMSWASVTNHPK